MDNTQIKQILNMLEKKEYDKAETFLKQQLLKTENKEKYNLTALVKKIIFAKGLGEVRPGLASIQITNGNTQSICNGVIGIQWKKHESCLDTFPQNSINPIYLDQIFTKYPKYELTDNDKIILKNLKKVKDYIRANYKLEEKALVYLFGKIFDLNVIEETLKICLSYNQDLEFSTDKEKLYVAVNIENENMKAIILPVRVKDEQELKEKIERTQKICDILGEN